MIDTKRFVGPNGEFQPTHQLKKGTINIGYLEELLEWLYYHDSIPNKMERILSIEYIIQNLLNGRDSRNNITYKPTWSKKLIELTKR
jgi:hypothetical protein